MRLETLLRNATHVKNESYDIPIRLYDLESPCNQPVYNMSGLVLGEIISEWISFFVRYSLSYYDQNMVRRDSPIYIELGTSRVQVPCYILSYQFNENYTTQQTIGSLERIQIPTSHELNFTLSINFLDVNNIDFPGEGKKKVKRKPVIYLNKFDILDI
jgi:hypothetical protein